MSEPSAKSAVPAGTLAPAPVEDSPRVSLRIPWIARKREWQVVKDEEPAAACPVFPAVQLAHQDRTRRFQLLDAGGGLRWHVLQHQAGGPSGADAGGEVIVLRGERNPVQWTAPAAGHNLALRDLRLLARTVGIYGDIAMDLPVHRLDASENRIDQLDRR